MENTISSPSAHYLPLLEAMSDETLKQEINGRQFLIYCSKEDKYVTKLMSIHVLINEVPTHKTFRCINGEWILFNYTENISRHNKAKH